MTSAALMLMTMLPAAEPAEVHDVLLEVGDKPALRLRLKIELDGKPLAKFDADATRTYDAIKGKPGATALDRLMPDGLLLRADALPAEPPHPAALSKAIFKALDTNGDGKLSGDELANAEKVLLGKFDLDDDECITPLELVPDLQTVVLDVHARPSLPSEKPAMPKALLAADRAEVKTAFEKTAAGVVSLTAVPGPVGLFDLLDTDRDGQLSVAELRAAKTVLANWSPSDTGVSLVIVPGVAKPPAVPLVRTFTRNAGPAWFRAMDKNGDGFVSPREFIGTPEQFRKLDTNGDGLISPEEAATATPPEVKKP